VDIIVSNEHAAYSFRFEMRQDIRKAVIQTWEREQRLSPVQKQPLLSNSLFTIPIGPTELPLFPLPAELSDQLPCSLPM
jgi:hypothetical protein